MTGETDRKDQTESRKIAIVLIALVAVLAIAGMLLFPTLSVIAQTHLSPGLGLKDAAVIAFFVTVAIMIIFAIASGDGLLGEIQFIIGGFFLFFVIIWMMIAWIF